MRARANAGDLAGDAADVSGALRLMLMLNVPATVGLIVLAQPIVALLLQRGRFTAADTAATAAALMFYAPGLLGYSAVKIASPSFLRAPRQPHAGASSASSPSLANLALNLAARARDGLSRAGARHRARRDLQRRPLLWLLRGDSAAWKVVASRCRSRRSRVPRS